MSSNKEAHERLKAVGEHFEKVSIPTADIAKERSMSGLTREDIRLLTHCMDGGKRETELKEKFMLEFERDLTFKNDDIHDLTKDQVRERTMERVAVIANYLQSESVETFTKRMGMVSIIDPSAWTRRKSDLCVSLTDNV